MSYKIMDVDSYLEDAIIEEISETMKEKDGMNKEDKKNKKENDQAKQNEDKTAPVKENKEIKEKIRRVALEFRKEAGSPGKDDSEVLDALVLNFIKESSKFLFPESLKANQKERMKEIFRIIRPLTQTSSKTK